MVTPKKIFLRLSVVCLFIILGYVNISLAGWQDSRSIFFERFPPPANLFKTDQGFSNDHSGIPGIATADHEPPEYLGLASFYPRSGPIDGRTILVTGQENQSRSEEYLITELDFSGTLNQQVRVDIDRSFGVLDVEIHQPQQAISTYVLSHRPSHEWRIEKFVELQLAEAFGNQGVFNQPTNLSSLVFDMTVQDDGSILILVKMEQQPNCYNVLRLNDQGQLNLFPPATPGNKTCMPGEVMPLKIISSLDGIYIAGTVAGPETTEQFFLTRIRKNGLDDESFQTSLVDIPDLTRLQIASIFNALTLDRNGHVIAALSSYSSGTTTIHPRLILYDRGSGKTVPQFGDNGVLELPNMREIRDAVGADFFYLLSNKRLTAVNPQAILTGIGPQFFPKSIGESFGQCIFARKLFMDRTGGVTVVGIVDLPSEC